jgi:hypothetical protein
MAETIYQEKTAKERAVKYVRTMCKLFSHTTEFTNFDRSISYVDQWKPMNLAHWFMALRAYGIVPKPKFWHKNTMLLDQNLPDDENELEFQLDLDSLAQHDSFYEAFCKRVNI